MDVNENYKPDEEVLQEDERHEDIISSVNITTTNVAMSEAKKVLVSENEDQSDLDDDDSGDDALLIELPDDMLTCDETLDSSEEVEPNCVASNETSLNESHGSVESLLSEESLESNLKLPSLIPIKKREEQVEMIRAENENSREHSPMPDLIPIPEIIAKDEGTESALYVLLVKTPEQKPSSEAKDVKKKCFADSLLDKFRKSSDESESEFPMKLQKYLSESDDDLLVEVETPVRFGKVSNPNQLPTPIVRNQRPVSVFVNSEKEYNEMVAKHKVRRPSTYEDKAQKGESSVQPQMKAPVLPTNIQKPRTLAEKRQLVNGNNTKFLMLEQESKIYRQVQRKNVKQDLNYALLEAMIVEDVPINRGPWKVLTWLRTREGNFIQRYVNVDGFDYKLCGSRGNHRIKFLPPLSSKPFPKHQDVSMRSTRCCAGGKIRKRDIDTLVSSPNIRRFVTNMTIDPHLRLDKKLLNCKLTSIKPRPLSRKIELINENLKHFQNDEDNAFLGSYSTFRMPDIHIEVKVEPKVPLEPLAKKYLKEILPHRDLNENWCEFALTALNDAKDESSKDTFEFTVPYQDNKQTILVREILKAKEDNEQLRIFDCDDDDVDDMEWTFDKDCDKMDAIECEIVDIIKDLTNSVFINLNDDLFTRDDPEDRGTASPESPVKSKEAIAELSKITKPAKVSRTLKELMRLNANVFKSDSVCDDVSNRDDVNFVQMLILLNFISQENDMRRTATAHLGKIERELRPTVIVTDSDTIVLGNQQKESRRIKRAPKKFDDYLNPNLKMAADDSADDEPKAKKVKVNQKSNQVKEDEDVLYKKRLNTLDFAQAHEESKIARQEITKMLHVSVDVQRLDNLKALVSLCMVHQLYKCHCKGSFVTGEAVSLKPPSELPVAEKKVERPSKRFYGNQFTRNRANSSVTNESLDSTSEATPDPAPQPEDETVKRKQASALFFTEGSPKIEIVNLSDLINGLKGPILINIFDNSTLKLNPILRTVLNNKSAIVYFDTSAYFIDKSRLRIEHLDFSTIMMDVVTPIFIIQGKERTVGPTVSTNFKVPFQKNKLSIIQITDATALADVEEIVDSILKTVKKKIESKIGDNRSELVNQQLEMLTTKRVRADSLSSSHSSPLSFQGHKLLEAPPPGMRTLMMQEFNMMFTQRMQRLVMFINSNALGLRPSREMFNKFYIYQWSMMIKSFEEDLVQVWQVTFESEEGNHFQMLAMTDSQEPPEVEHATKENVVNIRKLSLSDNLTELTRLILLRIENGNMKNMTILLYGCKGYFRICGMLNSKESYVNGFVAKPNRNTHPRVAGKIQKIYHMWHAVRVAKTRHDYLKEVEKKAEKAKIQKKVPKIKKGPQKLPVISHDCVASVAARKQLNELLRDEELPLPILEPTRIEEKIKPDDVKENEGLSPLGSIAMKVRKNMSRR